MISGTSASTAATAGAARTIMESPGDEDRGTTFPTGPEIVEVPRPSDIRAEREAAIHLLLRMGSLAAFRIVSLLVLDAVALYGALALTVRTAAAAGLPALPDPGSTGLVVAYSALFGVAAMGAYGAGDRRRNHPRIAMGLVLGFAAAGALSQLMGVGAAPVSTMLLMLVIALGLVLTGRSGIDALSRSVTFRGLLERRVLLIGDEPSTAAVLAHFNGSVGTRLKVVGRLEPAPPPGSTADGGVGELNVFLQRNPVDVVVISAQLPAAEMRRVVTTAFRRGVRVELVPTPVRDNQWMIQPQILFGCPVLEVRPSRLGVPQLALKRAFDLGLAGLLFIVLAPLFAMIAAAIKLDSRGPVVFRQARAGLGGKPFTIYKFRTMEVDADHRKAHLDHLNGSGDRRLFKIARDPRVTRVGAILRRLSLDELPQLFNIIRGDMSFVGPRPFFLEDFELYEPHHFERLTVLPGLTGLWQVSGRSEITDFDRVVRLDQTYIRKWSLFLDFRIILKTLPALIRRNGAY